MTEKIYNKLFAKRSVISFFMIMLLLFTCVLRISIIINSNYKQIQENQSIYRINISKLRGTIYDCNMVPITNNETTTVAAVLPIPSAIIVINRYADEYLKNNLRNKMPIVCNVPKILNVQGIKSTSVYKTKNSELSACHIIGYTDSTGHGVSGLELAYDEILYSDKTLSAIFTVNGMGNGLGGVEPYFENDLSAVKDGVVTTLDLDIQNVTEKALSNLNSGCAIVADAATGKIRAMASVPSYNIDNIAEALNAADSPMINRALACYSVGSVFKPCVAASLIENGYNYTYDCFGSLEIEGRRFKCHKLDGHGTMNLQSSLAQSCNCFFYKSAINLGAEKMYKTAASLSISARTQIAENLYSSKGVLPHFSTLNTDSALANLSIGQGSLMASPVAMLNLYLSIAGDGSYYLPSIVEKTIKQGVIKNYNIGYKTRIMNENTAEILRDYLKTVITDGTGKEAAPTLCTAAGKTATAQTGRYYDDGTEITNSWFCGFFPAENPKYVVVVMSDSKLNVSTASVFSKIADSITEISN